MAGTEIKDDIISFQLVNRLIHWRGMSGRNHLSSQYFSRRKEIKFRPRDKTTLAKVQFGYILLKNH